MSSCGNPSDETDVLMSRRPKFDKSKHCIKCKLAPGNLVIRHAVYCKECFFSVVITKFRRVLGASVQNSAVDGKKWGTKQNRASGNLLIAFSGGLGSTVLLDLVSRCYSHSAPPGVEDERPHGGRNHPRNGGVWREVVVCYVEVCNAFPGMRDMTQQIREVVERYEGFKFVPLRIEDAFDSSWWELVGGRRVRFNLGVHATSEDLSLSYMTRSTNSIKSMENYIASLPTHTAVSSAIQDITRMLLLYTASSTKSSHLVLGTSLTSLSIALISSISQGGGFVLREENEEEWEPDTNAFEGEVVHSGAIRVIRPLRDVGIKECALWAWWRDLKMVVGRGTLPGAKQGIGGLTKDFIIGLERDYPSTVPAITRTCGKLTPKEGAAAGTCPLCDRPVQRDIQDWKGRISIRSLTEPRSENYDGCSKLGSLAPHLCYACHTTLTSRSSRGSTSAATGKENQTGGGCAVTLPVWVGCRLLGQLDERGDVAGESDGADKSIHVGNLIGEADMKNRIAEFLLDDGRD